MRKKQKTTAAPDEGFKQKSNLKAGPILEELYPVHYRGQPDDVNGNIVTLEDGVFVIQDPDISPRDMLSFFANYADSNLVKPDDDELQREEEKMKKDIDECLRLRLRQSQGVPKGDKKTAEKL